jgi:hypothetical protein
MNTPTKKRTPMSYQTVAGRIVARMLAQPNLAVRVLNLKIDYERNPEWYDSLRELGKLVQEKGIKSVLYNEPPHIQGPIRTYYEGLLLGLKLGKGKPGLLEGGMDGDVAVTFDGTDLAFHP